jgi:hypothetical protein
VTAPPAIALDAALRVAAADLGETARLLLVLEGHLAERIAAPDLSTEVRRELQSFDLAIQRLGGIARYLAALSEHVPGLEVPSDRILRDLTLERQRHALSGGTPSGGARPAPIGAEIF